MSLMEVPEHIAIIMDGNRRWAKKRGLPSASGHKAGYTAFRQCVESCLKYGVKILTVYAFSVENMKRTVEEVSLLMQLFEFYIDKERKYLLKNGVKFKILGDLSGLPKSLVASFRKAEEVTADCKEMTLNMAVNYGGRNEIVYAAKNIASQVQKGTLSPEQIDEALFASNLYTAGEKDPDLLIRTSGELRLSNFLLWQSAYTEFVFLDLLWPDFDEAALVDAMKEYTTRIRRFGG